MDGDIPAGSRWRDAEANNRVAVVIGPGPNSPWMYYEDDPTRSPWYCCVEDFFIWKRFEKLS